MNKYKVTFYVEYRDKEVRIFESIIFAKDTEEVKRNALKVFINEQIEAETQEVSPLRGDGRGVLDDATIIQLDTTTEPEKIETD